MSKPTIYPHLGQIERYDPRIESLLADDVQLEVLASGFKWSEGPVWLKNDPTGEEGGCLLFSDIPRNQVVRWKEGKGITVFLEPSGYTGQAPYGREPGSNGLTLDIEGRLVSCEHGDRRISVLYWDGGKRTLADRYDGKRFNSPNDVVVKSDGSIYFTDPTYGLPEQGDDPRREQPHRGVYRIATDGTVTLATTEMTHPNGLAFSPDESVLYIGQSDTDAAVWKAFPVQEDGSLGESHVLFDATPMSKAGMNGAPDGFKVDEHGNIWASGPGGFLVISPDGTLLARIDTVELGSNCAFGGADGTELYLTVNMYLCRLRTKVRGAVNR